MKLNLMTKSLWIGLLCAAVAGPVFAAEAKVATTLDNLKAAYNGESNAKAQYDAFAVKADAEGYKQVAAFFRAASKSESIHADHHAKQIKKLGAIPKADIKKAEVKSTKENLEAAMKGESYERDSMYPEFIKQAEADKNSGAAMSFKGALVAETAHAKLCAEALANLASWKASSKEFLVCLVCGYTTTDTTLKQCPLCFAPREKFVSFK